jgi:hypothetical protein
MPRRIDAAGAVDAPTAPWKTAQNAVSHSAHTPHRFLEEGDRNHERHEVSPTHKIPDTPPRTHERTNSRTDEPTNRRTAEPPNLRYFELSTSYVAHDFLVIETEIQTRAGILQRDDLIGPKKARRSCLRRNTGTFEQIVGCALSDSPLGFCGITIRSQRRPGRRWTRTTIDGRGLRVRRLCGNHVLAGGRACTKKKRPCE